jgi:cell division protein FtsW
MSALVRTDIDVGPPTAEPKAPAAVSEGSGLDLWLAGSVMGLVLFGLVMVVSASSHFGLKVYASPWGFGLRQVVGVVLGLVAGAAIWVLPWKTFERLPRPFFWASLAMLAAVQSPLGHAAKGAPRWVNLGVVNLQPSEFAKIALAMILARHLARNEGRAHDIMGVVVPGVAAYLGPMLVLVALQSDLGTMALLGGITLVAVFVAGLEWRWIGAAILAAVGGAALLIAYEPYRAARLMSFVDPHAAAEGGGYQIVQGWVAIAVGGVTGQGLGAGVAQQGFLPEAHTDMIMAVVGEELGIVGWSFAFFLHGVILLRGARIAIDCRHLFEMIIASCITAVIAAQVVINTAVIGGLVPPKGLVFPFVSYGASAMIFNLVEVAILLRIARENHRGRRAERAATDPGTNVGANAGGVAAT